MERGREGVEKDLILRASSHTIVQRQVLSRDDSSDGGKKALELFCAECLEENLRKRGEENAERAMIEKEKKKSATTEGVTAAKLPGQSGNCTLAARQSEVSRLSQKSERIH